MAESYKKKVLMDTVMYVLLNSTFYQSNLYFPATTNNGDSTVSQFTSVLTLPNARDETEGKYQCIISNHLGSVHSNKAQITVHGKSTNMQL